MNAALLAALTEAANDTELRGNDALGLLARYVTMRAAGTPITVSELLKTGESVYEACGQLDDLVEHEHLVILGEDTTQSYWDDPRPVVLPGEEGNVAAAHIVTTEAGSGDPEIIVMTIDEGMGADVIERFPLDGAHRHGIDEVVLADVTGMTFGRWRRTAPDQMATYPETGYAIVDVERIVQ